MHLLRHFAVFTWLQARSCIFPFTLLGFLWLTQQVQVPGLARYDLMLLLCLGLQWLMIRTKLETWDEAKTIALFHVVGIALELFKVRMGSWSYPEEAVFKVAGVPLYAGFMYASVGSYICQAWRNFDLKVTGWPPDWQVISVTGAAYANFFGLHYLPDVRWPLILLILWVFRRVRVSLKISEARYRVPLVGSYFCIGFFVWVAENVATMVGAWVYPNQASGWAMVNTGKISSWSLLVIISIVLVAQLKKVKSGLGEDVDVEALPSRI